MNGILSLGENMNILIVNDDGIDAKGINILKKYIGKFGTVYTSAPKYVQSGRGHAVTSNKKIIVDVRDDRTIAVDGTPADCVKVALKHFDVDFDLLVSGINDSPNIGLDVFISGTIAAATEGAFNGIPSIAMSCGSYEHFSVVEKHINQVLSKILDGNLVSKEYVLNINFPRKFFNDAKDIVIVKCCEDRGSSVVREYEDSYILIFEEISLENIDKGTDVYAINRGYISITPLMLDRTNHSLTKKISL